MTKKYNENTKENPGNEHKIKMANCFPSVYLQHSNVNES